MSTNSEDSPILEVLHEELSKETPDNPYERFFLLSNPFPSPGQIHGICVNQETVIEEFTQKLREFFNDSKSQIMTIHGSTGAGKTNLLRFLENTLRSWRIPSADKKAITVLPTVYIEQPQGSYLEVHRQIIGQFGAMFLSEFVSVVRQSNINLTTLTDELSGVNPELIQALTYISHGDTGQLTLPSVSRLSSVSHEAKLYRTMGSWLQGGRLTVADKELLGNVTTEVGKSSTVAIKLLSDLVKVYLHVGLFKGVIIFIDEFEEVFSGLSRTNQAQYAQDLRNLFDSHPNGVVFVVATAPVAEQLQNISPALQRRLGSGVQIAPISDETTALEYAKAYIEWGRDEFETKLGRAVSLPPDCPATDRPYYPLTETNVKKVYVRLRESDTGANVIPGDLLPELNQLLYQVVYKS